MNNTSVKKQIVHWSGYRIGRRYYRRYTSALRYLALCKLGDKYGDFDSHDVLHGRYCNCVVDNSDYPDYRLEVKNDCPLHGKRGYFREVARRYSLRYAGTWIDLQ